MIGIPLAIFFASKNGGVPKELHIQASSFGAYVLSLSIPKRWALGVRWTAVLLAALFSILAVTLWGSLWRELAVRRAFATEIQAEIEETVSALNYNPYLRFLSVALERLAKAPSSPRGLVCFLLKKHGAPSRLQPNRESWEILEGEAALAVPSADDILSSSPWNLDSTQSSLAADDWALLLTKEKKAVLPHGPRGEEGAGLRPPCGKDCVEICTFGDPLYGVSVTAPLSTLLSSTPAERTPPASSGSCARRTSACLFPWRRRSAASPKQLPSSACSRSKPQSAAASLYDGRFALDLWTESKRRCRSRLGWSFQKPFLTGSCVADRGPAAVSPSSAREGRTRSRRILHFVSGPEPLTPRELWCIDAAFAAMPDALLRWHVFGTEAFSLRAFSAADSASYPLRVAQFAQLQMFWRAGFDLQVVQHRHLRPYLRGECFACC